MCWIPWHWSFKPLGTTVWVLGIKLGSFERAASVSTIEPSLQPPETAGVFIVVLFLLTAGLCGYLSVERRSYTGLI